jgi:isoleucyl-tRNA synthetase
MSKRLKNYPDPVEVCNEFSADAVRLYLINSPLVRADNLNFSKEGVRGVVREVFLPWYNAYRFLIQNISKWEAHSGRKFEFVEEIEQLRPRFNVTDRWVESALQTLIASVRREMGEYKLYNVVPVLIKFLEALTNWYVRLNRSRLKGEADEGNWAVSLNVLFDVLLKVNVLLSPQVPFITELMFQNMRLVLRPHSQLAEASIHHLRIAAVNEGLLDPVATEQMANFMAVVETARKLREQKKVSLKQPISSLTVINRREAVFAGLGPFLSYVRDEVNVDDIRHEANVEKYVRLEALPNLPVLGPKFKGNKTFGEVQAAIKKLTTVELEKLRESGSIVLAGNTLETVLLQLFRAIWSFRKSSWATTSEKTKPSAATALCNSTIIIAFCLTQGKAKS